jgi:hypothetical protein
MKNLITSALLLLALLLPATATAYDFEVDGICYNYCTDGVTVEVTRSPNQDYFGDMTIPAAVNYNGVTYPVTAIGEYAFAYSSDLTSVSLPNSLAIIGRYAFFNCSSLSNVAIPNSVTAIGELAFRNCSSLTSIIIPNSVTRIGDGALGGCSGLTQLLVARENPTYDSRNNCNAIIETASNTLIAGCNSSTIPNSVTAIGKDAFFMCAGLTSVTIPSSVTTIGDDAFAYCEGLTSVTIPNSVTTIGNYAFTECRALMDVSIPSSVTSIGWYAFSGCISLTSVDIPNSVTEIMGHTFADCRSLTSVTIPNTITAIGEWAFGGCTSLTSVTIPNSVTVIGEWAFSGCTGLASLTIGNSVTTIYGHAFNRCLALTSVDIPNSVTTIGIQAFAGCSGLRSMTIPNSVTSIGRAAFSQCTSLRIVSLPNSITTIEDAMFYGCTSLSSVNFPSSITAIGKNAFQNCSSLNGVNIPSSVTTIGEAAFQDCSSLVNLNIPNSVIFIGRYAFDGTAWYNYKPDGVIYAGLVAYKYKGTMPAGTSVVLKDGTLSIADFAFFNCSNLTSLTIPSSLTTIGYMSFYLCNGLENIIVASGSTTYDSRNDCNAIIETASNTLIMGCKNTVIPYSVITIGENAFFMCEGLTRLDIPNSVTTIGKYSFYGCTGLTSVIIPNSVTTIGNFAFEGCSALTKVSIPSSVTTIVSGAFRYCDALNDVYSCIEDPSEISMGGYVFYQTSSDYSGRTLHVPYGTSDAYQADDRWSYYFGEIVEDLTPGGLRGDVNGDFEVDIADINAIMDVIMGIDDFTTAVDVNEDGEVTIADINALIEIISAGNENLKHEYVDLGLPSGTLWATCNIGASNPEDFGDCFSWGETSPKSYYDWSTYKWCNGSNNSLTKYCTDSSLGIVDNKTRLDPEDDAAFVNWGSSWRTPTMSQCDELEQYCNWTWTKKNGVGGYLVTGRNGNSLFLPAAGHIKGNSNNSVGSNGYYWSLNLSSSSGSSYARGMDFTQSGHVGAFGSARSDGCFVRPVRMSLEDVYIEQKSLDLGGAPVGETCTGRLTIVNCSDESMRLTATTDAPFSFKQDDSSASTITLVVPSNSSAQVTVMFTATTPGQFNGNVTFQSPAFDGGQKVIPVRALAFNAPDPQQDYVDLGLPSGTLWSTRDVGANSPEECGDRFAWGETVPKNSFSVYNYKWCSGSYTTLTKYCTKSEYGTVDNLTVLEPEDDAATVNWGESWCMPSLAQIKELIYSCTFAKAELNGVIVRLVTGPNGNTMYMPADGYYWSRTLYESPDYAYGLAVDEGDWNWNYFWGPRANGHRVRAVRKTPDNLNIYIEQKSLDLGTVSVGETSTGQLTIVNNTNETVMLTATVDEPFSFKKGDGSASKITILVASNSTSSVTVMLTATTPGEFNSTVLFVGSGFEGGQRAVPVHAHVIPSHEYVDLGLPSGTLWATCNVGANTPEEFGDHFAWGEIKSKKHYNWNNYKWCTSGDNKFTKYCTLERNGTVDNLTILEPEDDAATVNWGPSWCMPSKAQMKELKTCCSWTWTSINGVNGQLVTGPNGNTLFLPASDYGSYSGMIGNVGSIGYYWSHTLDHTEPFWAYILEFDSELERADVWGQRCAGYSVRAVRVAPDNLNVRIDQRSLDLGEVSVGETCTGELTIVNNTHETVMLTATADAPFSFKKGEGSESSTSILLQGDSSRSVTVMFTATSPGEFNGNLLFRCLELDGGIRVVPVHARAH